MKKGRSTTTPTITITPTTPTTTSFTRREWKHNDNMLIDDSNNVKNSPNNIKSRQGRHNGKLSYRSAALLTLLSLSDCGGGCNTSFFSSNHHVCTAYMTSSRIPTSTSYRSWLSSSQPLQSKSQPQPQNSFFPKTTSTTTSTTNPIIARRTHHRRVVNLHAASSSSSIQEDLGGGAGEKGSMTSLSAAASASLSMDLDTFYDDDVGGVSTDDEPRVGVLLLNLGGPEKGEDVEGFLYNLFADPDIIRLPGPIQNLQSLIALFISKRRAPKSRAAYESIGGGSPILQYSNAQADLVKQSLQSRYNLPVQTYIGMRYWHPFTEEALSQIQKDNINALVILPLYPQFSISTSGSSLRVLQEEFARNSQLWGEARMQHTVIPAWYDRPGYLNAMANLIQHQLDSFTDSELQEGLHSNPNNPSRHVLFSAHGVPQSYIEAGDPYQTQIRECVHAISKLLPSVQDGVKIHLSYQSRVGPIEWLRPYTDDVLVQLGQEEKVKNLVVVPISFVSEHIETLEEIDIEYRELAEENGITNWRRCPALNTDPAFIEDMADMVYEALNEPSRSVTEACVANNVADLESLEKEGISTAGVGGVGADGDLFGTSSSSSSNTNSNNGGASTNKNVKVSNNGGTSNINGSSADISTMDQDATTAKRSSTLLSPSAQSQPQPRMELMTWQLDEEERFNGRLAILGVCLTLALEVGSGQPLTRIISNFMGSL
mmetsp:Transcript_14195/g.20271  ORF Transcript_14195/g.20271 Transcript_14195/m.20271 type:complete len:714 (-) Transcript_14195:264-2405(-)